MRCIQLGHQLEHYRSRPLRRVAALAIERRQAHGEALGVGPRRVAAQSWAPLISSAAALEAMM